MESLPDELLLKIFEFVDNKTLRTSVIEVSERWRTLVFSSSFIINQHQLTIDLTNFDVVQPEDLKLPYRKYIVNLKDYNHTYPLHTMDKHLKLLINRNAENIFFYKPTPGLLTKTLEGLDNLTHLDINDMQTCPYTTSQSSDFEELPVSLPSLKQLEVHGVNSFLKMFKNHQVETLRISNYTSESNHISRSLNYFLKNAPKLKYFYISAQAPKLEVDKFKFKLETLDWMNVGLVDENLNVSPVMDLLRSQKDNLKEFSVKGFVSSKIVELAVNILKVTNLTLDMEKTFTEAGDLRINRHIKKLTLESFPNNYRHGIKLIVHCPEVEHLSLSSLPNGHFNEFMLNVSQTMRNLKKLDLMHITDEIRGDVSFDSLEELSFYASNMRHVASFLNGCRNLKTLEMKNFNENLEAEELRDVLNNARKLTTLYITGNFELNEEITDVFLNTESSLKYLTMDIYVNRRVAECIRRLTSSNIHCTVPKLLKYQEREGEQTDTEDECSCEDSDEEELGEEEESFDDDEQSSEEELNDGEVSEDDAELPEKDEPKLLQIKEAVSLNISNDDFNNLDSEEEDTDESLQECYENSLKRPRDDDNEEDEEESDGFVDENDEYGLLQEIKRPRRS